MIVPVAFVRQQDQEHEDGTWIANNYNIFIYPLYDYNLYDSDDKENDLELCCSNGKLEKHIMYDGSQFSQNFTYHQIGRKDQC